MKRIGIITLYKDNYGSELQCYATKHYLESLGYRCDVLDERFIGIDKLLHKLDGWRDTVWKTIRYRGFWANRKEMKIALGCDHAAYELKEAIKEKLTAEGHEVLDMGCDSTESVDYPKYGHAVGRAVAAGDAERGIAVCGSGIGISIAAFKERPCPDRSPFQL